MVNWETLSVFVGVFIGVTILAFWAAHWRQGDLNRLQEWGLAGRRFGTIITWCLLGGDIYTAYTLIALPGYVFAFGAMGFYAIPYLTVAYIIFALVMPKFWMIARHSGYVTPADFVRERFDSPALALMVAITGIVATMPYIALQMYGMEVIIVQMGLTTPETSLIIAFGLLAIYTYIGGIRAPAVMAVVKDIFIWLVVLVAIIYIPIKVGGFAKIFQDVHTYASQGHSTFRDMISPNDYSVYGSLIVGSALALFLYPHTLTGVLSANSARVVRRSSVLLLTYTFLVGLIALLAFVAVAEGIQTGGYGSNGALPGLLAKEFPPWLVGFSFAALAIGALVPAAIMSIATANLFSRNIYREYINRACTERQEANMAKTISLVVKVGALVFILFGPTSLAINLQHVGNIWVIQTLPPVFLGLYTNWFHRRALMLGLLGGLFVSTWMLVDQNLLSPSWTPVVPIPLDFLQLQPFYIYVAVPSLLINLVLCIGLTPIFHALRIPSGRDYTTLTEFGARPVRHPF